MFGRFDWLPQLGVSLAIHCFATGAKMASHFETFSEDEMFAISVAVVQTHSTLSVFTDR